MILLAYWKAPSSCQVGWNSRDRVEQKTQAGEHCAHQRRWLRGHWGDWSLLTYGMLAPSNGAPLHVPGDGLAVIRVGQACADLGEKATQTHIHTETGQQQTGASPLLPGPFPDVPQSPLT